MENQKVSSTIRRVLIASSDAELATSISGLLHPSPQSSFVCQSADSLRMALDKLRSHPFDVVLLDLQLDNADGLATMQSVRADTQAPIVILTHAGSEIISLQCLEEGAQEYLPKEDLSTVNLRRALSYAISHHRANDLRLRLEHSDKLAALGQLTAGVAHEINNPATYVLGNLNQIQDIVKRLVSGDGHKGDIELIAEMAADCHQGVELIANISRELKFFARNDDATTESVNIRELINNTSAMTLNEIRYRAEFEQRVADVPNIMGNRSRLSQVVVNLLINAAHSIDSGASTENRIAISADFEEGLVVIRVRDTGCGISPAAMDRIFETYYTTKAHGLGTGLGLPICKEIILQHKGKIEVQSQVSVGTTFTLRLPVGAAITMAPRPQPRPISSPDKVTRRRILLIDDEPLLLKSLARMLQAHHDVVATMGGKKALKVLSEDARFDTIICDLMMPEVDGMHVYEALRSDHPHLVKKLIYLSGGVFTDRMSNFLDELGPRLLDKPVSRDELLAAIAPLQSDPS